MKKRFKTVHETGDIAHSLVWRVVEFGNGKNEHGGYIEDNFLPDSKLDLPVILIEEKTKTAYLHFVPFAQPIKYQGKMTIDDIKHDTALYFARSFLDLPSEIMLRKPFEDYRSAVLDLGQWFLDEKEKEFLLKFQED